MILNNIKKKIFLTYFTYSGLRIIRPKFTRNKVKIYLVKKIKLRL